LSRPIIVRPRLDHLIAGESRFADNFNGLPQQNRPRADIPPPCGALAQRWKSA
jgi:hypothetical protein